MKWRRVWLPMVSATPMVLAVVVPGQQQTPQSKEYLAGQKIFAKTCAPCHGEAGVGGAGYSTPLTGSKSLDELGTYIAGNMPPGKKHATKADAKLLAAYMHAAFYSPVAQERNRPARVSLARLTVKQYKNALADLVGDYHAAVNPGQPGLYAQYFTGKDGKKENRKIERVDGTVNFSFPKEGPGQVDPKTYLVTWAGAILAPDTGDYDLIIQTDQAAALHLNGDPKPTVDGLVRSGNQTEYKAAVHLLGGRSYSVYMEFKKWIQGVQDPKLNKTEATPAFVRLMWRRPKGAVEVIPSAYLVSAWNQPTYVDETAFPADDRSIGYERGNAITKQWDDATTRAAVEAADQVVKRAKENQLSDPAKARELALGFVTRAFRRPVDAETAKLYVDKQFAGAKDVPTALRRSVALTLLSPRFLYREIGPSDDPYKVAAEISFGLWDSLPDPELLRAAGAGELKTAEGRAKQAQRMAADPRAWTKLRDFLMLWLKVDEIPDIVKSQKAFPGFDDSTATDLRTSLDLFLREVAWGPRADYRELMLSDRQYVNGRLAKIYGGNLAADAPFQAVASPDRAGVLTQPYVMARFAYLEGSSPIHRGVLVARNMLGRVLAPPPVAVAPTAASLHPELTTRERVALQTKNAPCNTCHGMINPLGFAFEEYDAIGRVRKVDNGKPVDASGEYTTRTGATVKFKNARDLAVYLAGSDEAQAAFVEKLFQNVTKQPVRAYGPTTLQDLLAKFKAADYNMRSLLVDIVLTAARGKA